jgi:hypothetical protein
MNSDQELNVVLPEDRETYSKEDTKKIADAVAARAYRQGYADAVSEMPLAPQPSERMQ